jgi:hypothetical protein
MIARRALAIIFAMGVALALGVGYIAYRNDAASQTCVNHGGTASWPWWENHPAGVLMCNDGMIVGPPDAIARCYAANICRAIGNLVTTHRRRRERRSPAPMTVESSPGRRTAQLWPGYGGAPITESGFRTRPREPPASMPGCATGRKKKGRDLSRLSSFHPSGRICRSR